jgi:hypothetical protein
LRTFLNKPNNIYGGVAYFVAEMPSPFPLIGWDA